MARGSSTATLSRDDLAQAADPELHRTHMALLSQSRQRTVRETIASRRDVPLGIQAVLADDDWHEVRAAIASNPRAARSVLERLSQDKHRDVLVALIMNPEVPRDLVENLAGHRKEEVRDAASTRLRLGRRFREEQELTLDEKIPELRDTVILLGSDEVTEQAEVAHDTWLPDARACDGLAEEEPWPFVQMSPFATLVGQSLAGGFRTARAF